MIAQHIVREHDVCALQPAAGLDESPPSTEEPEEPHHLCCPITHALFRDPVFVGESGNTYEHEAIVSFWNQSSGIRVSCALDTAPSCALEPPSCALEPLLCRRS